MHFRRGLGYIHKINISRYRIGCRKYPLLLSLSLINPVISHSLPSEKSQSPRSNLKHVPLFSLVLLHEMLVSPQGGMQAVHDAG